VFQSTPERVGIWNGQVQFTWIHKEDHMRLRDLQNVIEDLYRLKEDGSKDSELGRITGLTASVGQINTAVHMNLTGSLPIGEMRQEIEEEMTNLLTFMFLVGSYYDFDIEEQIEILQSKILGAVDNLRGADE